MVKFFLIFGTLVYLWRQPIYLFFIYVIFITNLFVIANVKQLRT